MERMDYKYCNNLVAYSRLLTREVNIGGVKLGGHQPVRIQSMTNTPTMDTRATVEQCIRIINAGADLVRITAPGLREAENLANIKSLLLIKGYNTPLIADIHYNPKAAEVAAKIVEKVRINPGNYTDKKKFEKLNFTDLEYKLELEKVHEKLLPLLKICQTHGTVIRIGVNHGSLSDRLMSRYGDTPKGMVESAMEFLRICSAENFHNLVISLKSSNTRVMVQAYRLLVNSMISENMNYPLHLGVTEAGDGEDGRIKSAVGIGSLMADGIGDTIRVSLTEDPEAEVPVAKILVDYFSNRKENQIIEPFDTQLKNPFEYQKRETITIDKFGGKNLPQVIVDWNENLRNEDLSKNTVPDYFYLNPNDPLNSLPDKYNYILNLHDWFKKAKESPNIFPVYTDAQFIFYGPKHKILNFVIVSNPDATDKFFESLEGKTNVVIILETFNTNGIADQRAFLYQLLIRNIKLPVITNRNYSEDNLETLQLKSASDLGIFFVDGFSDGIWLRNAGQIECLEIINTSFGILQASRVRMSKTEYISCPSCGRTMFDLQTTTSLIKEKTSHLRHLKIGIMGCIVNGPGEMADADYGFVGAGAGKITLYKSKQVIKREIPSRNAVDELIQIIKENGDWLEPEN
jgi:(E)-4-hydroxy-3-methylbut-2-enyl-diphosphate synthase